MILPDINVLVYAYRRESLAHERYAAWLSDLVSGADEVALAESKLTGFLRIVTIRRIYPDPAPCSMPSRSSTRFDKLGVDGG
jgi:predicted nucleic acid-binding protein